MNYCMKKKWFLENFEITFKRKKQVRILDWSLFDINLKIIIDKKKKCCLKLHKNKINITLRFIKFKRPTFEKILKSVKIT